MLIYVKQDIKLIMLAKNNTTSTQDTFEKQFSNMTLDKTTKDILTFILACLNLYQTKYKNQGSVDETIQNGNFLTIMEKESREKAKFYYCRNEYAGAKKKGMESKIDIGIIEINDKHEATLIFALECKRLHKPPSKSQQYVIVKEQKTGGIQRFKEESHAPSLSKSAIVGYMEGESFNFWFDKVNEWIENEAKSDATGFWNMNDKIESTQIGIEISQYQSKHNRRTQPEISLYHFWVKMY